MRVVGVRELKQNASRVLADVESEGEVVVTVLGRAVATLVPIPPPPRWVTTAELLDARVGGPTDDTTEWLGELCAARRSDDLFDRPSRL